MAEEKNLSEVFDIGRTGRTKEIVAEFERCFTDVQRAQDEIREIVTVAKSEQFRPKDIMAMKRIAKLRMKDKLQQAKEELAALERVSGALNLDLFDFTEDE